LGEFISEAFWCFCLSWFCVTKTFVY